MVGGVLTTGGASGLIDLAQLQQECSVESLVAVTARDRPAILAYARVLLAAVWADVDVLEWASLTHSLLSARVSSASSSRSHSGSRSVSAASSTEMESWPWQWCLRGRPDTRSARWMSSCAMVISTPSGRSPDR